MGRMADTQEFENFVLEKRQIAPELMALLQTEAGAKITDLGDRIAISHLYIERRMVPLNIWLEQVDGPALRDAVEEYGNAIRQLAAANIFPGDMLFKNFGATGCALTRASDRYLKRCTPTCCAPTTGGSCKRVSATATWKTSMPIAAVSVLACATAT